MTATHQLTEAEYIQLVFATPNGSYDETLYREGVVRPASLPSVAIDVAELYAVL